MYKNLIYTTIFSLVGLLSSCKTEADNKAPEIEILNISHPLLTDTVCGAVEIDNVFRLCSGQNLDIEFKLTDDRALSQLKIDIHENFDCHGHKSTVIPWQLLELIDLSGKEQLLSKTIRVPANATAGTYHFQIKLLDESGNEAGTGEAYSIKVLNTTDTIAPTAVINAPIQDNISISRGSLFQISVTASDNELLAGGRAEMVYFTTSGNRALAVSKNFEAGTGTNLSFNFDYTIPNTLPAGTYEFSIRVYDAVGNSFFSSPKILNLN